MEGRGGEERMESRAARTGSPSDLLVLISPHRTLRSLARGSTHLRSPPNSETMFLAPSKWFSAITPSIPNRQ